MSEQPGSGPQRQVNIRVPDGMRHGLYANFLVVSHSPHEFTLDFCQLQPGEDDRVTAEVVSRVRVAPTLVAQVIQALNTNLGNYEDRYDSVRAVGS